MNRFALEVNMAASSEVAPEWKFFNIPEDFSVKFTHNSPMFNGKNSGTFSESVEIYADANRHIVGNCDVLTGGEIFKVLHKKAFRLYFDGAVIMYGIVRLDKNVSIKRGKFEIELASDGQDFDDLISGMNCQDVDIDGDKVFLGTTVDEIVCDGMAKIYEFKRYRRDASREGGTKDKFPASKGVPSKDELWEYARYWFNNTAITDWKLVSSKFCASVNTIYLDGKSFFIADDAVEHTRDPYPTSKFCYDRKCWQQMSLKKNDDGTVKVDDGEYEWKAERGYGIADPDWQRYVTPNFYLQYFLDKLFSQLGYTIAQNDMTEYTDWNRLAFHNGNIHWKTDDDSIEYFELAQLNGNSWWDQKGQLNGYDNACDNMFRFFRPWLDKSFYLKKVLYDVESYVATKSGNEPSAYGVRGLMKQMTTINFAAVRKDCYATSENFPDESVDSVLEALENAFNIRFVPDSNNKTVKILSMDKVMREAGEIEDIECLIKDDVVKKSYGIDGYRVRYSASKVDEIRDYNSGKVEYSGDNDDARYNYTNYKDAVVVSHPYGYYNLVSSPADPFDKTCYIDEGTGAAFRVRVDADAEKKSELHASYFEVGACIPAEWGDCSKEAEDEGRVKDVSIGFTPTDSNMVDMYYGCRYATFIDEEIHSSLDNAGNWRLGEHGMSVVSSVEEVEADADYDGTTVSAKFGYQFLDQIAFDRSSGNEEHPLMSQDFGFELGIMRGRGNSGTGNTTPVYDEHGNSVLNVMTGHYPNFYMDSMDHEGRVFDYNGDADGIGNNYNGETRGLFRSANISKVVSTPSDYLWNVAVRYLWSIVNDELESEFQFAGRRLIITQQDIDSVSEGSTEWDAYMDNLSKVGDARVAVWWQAKELPNGMLRAYLFCPYDGNGNLLDYASFKEYTREIVSMAGSDDAGGLNVAALDRGELSSGEQVLFGKRLYIGYVDVNISRNINAGDEMRACVDTIVAYVAGYTDKWSKIEVDTSVPLNEMEKRISLKIKAEKPDGNGGYYEVKADGAANRGLGDKFHKRYAQFLIGAKEGDFPIADIDLMTLMRLEDFRLYRIGGVVGFVLGYEYKLDNKKGLRDVTIKMLYQ